MHVVSSPLSELRSRFSLPRTDSIFWTGPVSHLVRCPHIRGGVVSVGGGGQGGYLDSDSLCMLPRGPNVQSIELIQTTKLRGQ